MIETKIAPEDFAKTVNAILSEHDQEVNERFDAAGLEEAKKVVKELKAASKENFGNGSYSKGWSRKKKKQKSGFYKYIVWNKSDYRLTHLLENGHVKVLWGKRTDGTVSGKYHIKPVADSSEVRYLEAVKEALNK